MNYTQAQIDRANAVRLEDFLRTQGETLIKSGREYRWKEHDSLTVRGNKWFRHSQSKGGYGVSCDIHNSKLSSHSSKDFLETRIALPMRTILNSSCLTS